MGYYSDVTIRCEEEAYKEFKQTWKEQMFKPTRIYENKADGKTQYTVCWDGLKWYDYFPEVQAINEVMKWLDAEERCDTEGYGYKFIQIGEDNATVENWNERGDCIFTDFYIVIDLNLPSERIEIEED